MAKQTTDRRVQRTRALLQDALMALMIEKGFEDTTVQDIIDRANVGRATFYAHFADKKTLLTSRIEDLRALLSQRQQAAWTAFRGTDAPGFGFSLAMLEHAHGHLPLYTAIHGSERRLCRAADLRQDCGAKLSPRKVDLIFQRLAMNGLSLEPGFGSAVTESARG